MSVEMNLQFPDKEPGEAPATDKQKDYIRHLGQVSESDLQALGKWQASSLIDQMQDIRKSGIIENIEFDRNHKKKKRKSRTTFLVLALVLLCFWLFNPFRSSTQSGKIPADKAAQSQPIKIPKKGDIAQESPPITTLENVVLPITLISTKEFSLVDRNGKQTSIPAGSIIKVESRRESGALATRIKGEFFVGSEETLAGKVIKTDDQNAK